MLVWVVGMALWTHLAVSAYGADQTMPLMDTNSSNVYPLHHHAFDFHVQFIQSVFIKYHRHVNG